LVAHRERKSNDASPGMAYDDRPLDFELEQRFVKQFGLCFGVQIWL
jgi:hypothetical protein